VDREAEDRVGADRGEVGPAVEGGMDLETETDPAEVTDLERVTVPAGAELATVQAWVDRVQGFMLEMGQLVAVAARMDPEVGALDWAVQLAMWAARVRRQAGERVLGILWEEVVGVPRWTRMRAAFG
jgi:hypothetical protein